MTIRFIYSNNAVVCIFIGVVWLWFKLSPEHRVIKAITSL